MWVHDCRCRTIALQTSFSLLIHLVVFLQWCMSNIVGCFNCQSDGHKLNACIRHADAICFRSKYKIIAWFRLSAELLVHACMHDDKVDRNHYYTDTHFTLSVWGFLQPELRYCAINLFWDSSFELSVSVFVFHSSGRARIFYVYYSLVTVCTATV